MVDDSTTFAILVFATIAVLVFIFLLRRKREPGDETVSQERETDPNREQMEIVRIYTYHHEAAVIRARLEAEGIHTFLADEQTLSANPLMSNAIGGLKLMVPKDQVQRALEILKEDDDMRGWEEVDKSEDDEN